MPFKLALLLGLTSLLAACSGLSTQTDAAQAGHFQQSLSEQYPLLDAEQSQDHPLEHLIPDGILGPQAAQQLALVGSPEIEAALSGMGVAGARLQQAGLLSNPGFEIKALQPDGGGRWKTEFTLTLGLVDWLIRPLRLELAEAEWEEAQLQAWQTVSERLNAVQYAYYEAVAARHRAETQARVSQAASVNADFARELHSAGNLTELARLRYEAAAAEQEQARLHADGKAERAVYELNRLIGLAPDTALELPRVLPDLLNELQEAPLSFEALYDNALIRRPDMAILRQSETALQREQRLVSRQRGITQADLGLVAEREFSGDWHPGIALGLSLPLFDRGQAQLLSLDAEAGRQAALLAAADLRAQQEIATALSAMRTAYTSVQQLQDEDLPRYRRMLELALREYNFMLTGTFDLISVRQQALALELDMIDSLSDYWLARAALDQATGNALTTVAESRFDAPAEPDDDPHADHNHDHGHDQHNQHTPTDTQESQEHSNHD